MTRFTALLTCALLALAAEAWGMRIVSLAPSVTETLFALGAGGDVVGVSTYCDYPPEAAKVDKVGTFLAPSAEVILAKRPDLVIAVPSPANRGPVEALERIGLKVLVVDPETLDGIRRTIETIAAAVGRAEAGRDLLRRMDGDIAAIRTALAGVTPRRTLMVVGHSPLVAVGRGIYLDELIAMGGGINVAADAGGPWPHLSLEVVLIQAPEVIIDTSMGTAADAARGGAFWGELATLPAVRQGRVRGYRDDALLRPGPRVGAALATLARFIHPERFPPAGATP
jgi:iron complex transport system substrate-binding protein